jgi:hypothetical protein
MVARLGSLNMQIESELIGSSLRSFGYPSNFVDSAEGRRGCWSAALFASNRSCLTKLPGRAVLAAVVLSIGLSGCSTLCGFAGGSGGGFGGGCATGVRF